MEKVEKLEAAVGKPIEQWNVSDLEKFSSEENLELLQFLKEPAVITECLNRSKNNREVADLFVPLYVKSKLTTAERDANDLLVLEEDGKINKDTLLKEVEEKLINNECFYHKLAGYLIIISMFPDYKLEEQIEQIKAAVANLKEVICGLTDNDLFNCYSLIMELNNMLFPFRAKYFNKYNVDVLDDEDKRLSNTLDTIHAFEMEIKQQLESMAIQNDDIPEAILSELNSDEEGDDIDG